MVSALWFCSCHPRQGEEVRRPRGQLLLGVFRGVGTTVSWGVMVVQEDEEGRGKGVLRPH